MRNCLTNSLHHQEIIFRHGSYEYWCDEYTILPYHHAHHPKIGLQDIVTEGDPCLIVDSDEAKRLKLNLGFGNICNIAAAYEEDLQAREKGLREFPPRIDRAKIETIISWWVLLRDARLVIERETDGSIGSNEYISGNECKKTLDQLRYFRDV